MSIRALILAAGRGSRMGAATEVSPKCLVKLGSTTVLDKILCTLRSADIDSIGIVLGYKAEKIISKKLPLEYFRNSSFSNSNMVRSLYVAKDWFKQTTIVSYSDIVYTKATVRRLCESPGDIVISYDKNWDKLWKKRFANPLDDAETFKIDEHNKLLEIGQKASNISDITGQYMGLLKLTPTGWNLVANYLETLSDVLIDKMDMTTLLSNLIKQQIDIYAVPQEGGWFEVDSQADLDLYESEKFYESF